LRSRRGFLRADLEKALEQSEGVCASSVSSAGPVRPRWTLVQSLNLQNFFTADYSDVPDEIGGFNAEISSSPPLSFVPCLQPFPSGCQRLSVSVASRSKNQRIGSGAAR
jgi:hypothetical protein